MLEKLWTTCAVCNRVLYPKDADENGKCPDCKDKPIPKPAPPPQAAPPPKFPKKDRK